MRLRCKLEPFSWSNPHLKIDYPVTVIVPILSRASVIGDTFWWNLSMIWTSGTARGRGSAAVTVGQSILSSNGSARNALGGQRAELPEQSGDRDDWNEAAIARLQLKSDWGYQRECGPHRHMRTMRGSSSRTSWLDELRRRCANDAGPTEIIVSGEVLEDRQFA